MFGTGDRAGVLILLPALLAAADRIVIPFEAHAGGEAFSCGRRYAGIGLSATTILPRDFRFYIHNVRLIAADLEVPVELDQDSRWQLDDSVLLDFENGQGSCLNGTPDQNHHVAGSVPAGLRFRGLKFTLGVPFLKNHLDINRQPPPFNLTSLYWGWNGGYKFARLDFAIPDQRFGFAIHLGSTGCTPDKTVSTAPDGCRHPNRAEVVLPEFDPEKHVVVADLAALLKDTDLSRHDGGCMSDADDPSCGPIFANFGLAFGEHPRGEQSFFRAGPGRQTE